MSRARPARLADQPLPLLLFALLVFGAAAAAPAVVKATTRTPSPGPSGPLTQDPAHTLPTTGSIRPGRSYTTYGAMLYNSSTQPVQVLSWKPRGAHHLTVLGAELVTNDVGADVALGRPGWPPKLKAGPARAQTIGRGVAVVAPTSPLTGPDHLATGQWLVIGYQLADAHVRSASLEAIELIYRVGGEHRTRHAVVGVPIQVNRP